MTRSSRATSVGRRAAVGHTSSASGATRDPHRAAAAHWFTVLSGTAVLRLGDRTVLVHEGEAAEFSTMTPHVIGAHDGPVEILTVLDHDGERSHLRGTGDEPGRGSRP